MALPKKNSGTAHSQGHYAGWAECMKNLNVKLILALILHFIRNHKNQISKNNRMDAEVINMHEYAAHTETEENIHQNGSYLDQYSSVEISNKTIQFSYHFKLWKITSTSMCILVKEGSQILSQLKEGDTFNMKYYTSDPLCPVEYRDTAIQNITKDDHGRFKGHYLVYLKIQDNYEAKRAH